MDHSLDQIDFNFLQANAHAGLALGLGNFLHLDQPIGLWNYVRIANDAARQVPVGSRLLDWGCGLGQMTYLLQRRGLAVTAYDVRDVNDALPNTPLSKVIDRVVSQEPTHLPFSDSTFDAVLSCGVLEHVDECSQPGNERRSLREIARILKPGGKLLIYQLPQRDAWQEAIIRRFKLGYSHPRRYTTTEIKNMLHEAGLSVRRLQRANLIPKNLTGMPAAMRRIYSRASRQLIAADGAVSQLPVFRGIAGVLEVTAYKPETNYGHCAPLASV